MEYPFAALVGQEQLKTALLLNAVHPGVGGVLIRGEKGTAKSTAARPLAALLPPMQAVAGCPFHCDPAAVWQECPHRRLAGDRQAVEISAPFVDLPLGATEDRVLGTLDFERALREGRRALQPGLLAGAHRGVLYIDEVNLLPDHLVDVLLDAAAMGVNTLQREGLSVTHPARFLLIGTMNPEEGDLRPQLLDRFGLVVDVAGPRDPAVRTEVVRRRLAFESESETFAARWQGEQTALCERIAAARRRLPEVALDEGLLTFISQLCCESEVDGLRADLALHKTARARAAFEGRREVTLDDVRAAAELVLPHRQRRRPRRAETPPHTSLPEASRGSRMSDSPGTLRAGRCGEGSSHAEKVFEGTAAQAVPRIETSPVDISPLQGRRNPTRGGERGRFVRAVPDEKATDVAIGATVLAAAVRGGWADGKLDVAPADLHRKERSGRGGSLMLFVVDASGSMAARRRMELVKGTVLGLLRSAYEQRDEVAVIAFRGTQAEVMLSPTRSVERAEDALRVLPTGGRTPLAHALVLAGELVRQARRSRPDFTVLLVLLSDGRANVPLPGAEADPWRQAIAAAEELAAAKVPALVLDTDVGFVRLGRAEELAKALGATCAPLEDLSVEKLVLRVREQRG